MSLFIAMRFEFLRHPGKCAEQAASGIQSGAVWPAIPVHLGVEPAADVDERLGEDLKVSCHEELNGGFHQLCKVADGVKKG